MLKVVWARRIAPIPKFYGCHKSCAAPVFLSARCLRPRGQVGCYVYGSQDWRSETAQRSEALVRELRAGIAIARRYGTASSSSEVVNGLHLDVVAV
jgi:hypothetical protein